MRRSALTSSENSRTPSRSFCSNEKFASKTPLSFGNQTNLNRTNSKTPAKTPSAKTPVKNSRITPSRNSSIVGKKTPGGGDRFIPNRASSLFDLGHFMLTSQNESQSHSQLNESRSAPSSPNRAEFERGMRDNLNGGVSAPSISMSDLSSTGNSNPETNCRILAYQKGKAPLAPNGFANANRVLYSSRIAPASSCKKTLRHIPSTPERILDAPEIVDDYYLNLIDWSSRNSLAVALAGQVFLWTADTGEIELLTELESTSEYIASVSWCKDGNYLAVGLSTGDIQLWDANRTVLLRTLRGHSTRVGSLSWNQNLLTSGERSGIIHHHDVSIESPLVGTLSGHTQEVCGLQWSPDGRYLASGGNDNLLQIWPQVPNLLRSQSTPLYTLTEHQAAVKALAWCPWQPSILASGGGTADRQIRIWNITSGNCLSSTDAQSQVCSLLWSSEYKELISGHGYPSHQLALWKYPQMTKISELPGHSARVLSMAMSPCGEFVISAAGDESLRLWHCFGVDKEKRKRVQQQKSEKSSGGLLTRGIR